MLVVPLCSQASLEIIYFFWFIWLHFILFHLTSFDFIWFQLISIDFIWIHLNSFDFISFHLIWTPQLWPESRLICTRLHMNFFLQVQGAWPYKQANRIKCSLLVWAGAGFLNFFFFHHSQFCQGTRSGIGLVGWLDWLVGWLVRYKGSGLHVPSPSLSNTTRNWAAYQERKGSVKISTAVKTAIINLQKRKANENPNLFSRFFLISWIQIDLPPTTINEWSIKNQISRPIRQPAWPFAHAKWPFTRARWPYSPVPTPLA